MALISAKTILTSLCLFHVTLAFFFFNNPRSIADQALVYILGESMGMVSVFPASPLPSPLLFSGQSLCRKQQTDMLCSQPRTTAFDTPTPATSLLALCLLVIGLTDILTLSLPEEIWLVHHWASQAPLRVFLFSSLTIVTFLTTPKASRAPGRLSHPIALHGTGEGGGWDGLKNRVFFTLAFVEMLSWFWVWVTLREETRGFVLKKRRRSSGASRL